MQYDHECRDLLPICPDFWTMSAELENIVRAGGDMPEVINLQGVVEAWHRRDSDARAPPDSRRSGPSASEPEA